MADTAAATLPTPQFARLGAGLKPLLILLGLAAAVAAGVTVALWSQGPSWGLLYGSLANDDAAAVVQALQAANIKYKVDNATGGVMVPQDQVADARLKLAAQGLPAGDGSGFEMLNKDPGFGVSQSMENARFQHALEGELARTIQGLQAVEAARVHLAMPAQSAFVRDRRPGSASVFLKIRPGRRLEDEQVSGIVHLVASSIPELEADQVTVVDQQGRLLSAPKSPEAIATDARLEAARRIEQSYSERIEALLTPIVGQGRVRAEVTADIDTSATEESREQYRPDSQIVRSEQLAEETNGGGAAAGGVPGALSNTPPAGGVVQPPSAAPAPAGAAAAPGAANAAAATTDAAAAATLAATNASKQTTRNYEIDRTLSYTRQNGGRIRRLTVAVLLDNVRVVGKNGKPTEKPLAPKQIDDITRLVKDAVGFDVARGDSVNVVNSSFLDESQQLDDAGTPIWQQPMVRDIARILLGAAVLIVLLLSVVRPLLKTLTAGVPRPAAPQRGAPELPAALAGAGAGGVTDGALPALPAATPSVAALGYEQQIAAARSMVSQDPKLVAQVVKQWVSADE